MDSFIKTDQQEALVAAIRALRPAFREREAALSEPNAFPFENIEQLKEIGYPTLTLPTEFGGQGRGLYDFILGQEAISEASAETGLSIGWHTGIVLEFAENRHWLPQAAEPLLQAIAEGALLNTAATEANAGSPTRGALPRTTAKLNSDHYVLNGEKTYTSMSPALDYILVTATTEDDQVMIFIVPKEADGVSIRETWDSLAMRGTASHTLVLENVRVPKSAVLREQAGAPPAKGWLLHIPACYAGIAAAASQQAIEFAANYVPASLGKPIAETPHIRQAIGEMQLELQTARHLLYGTVERYENATDKAAMAEALDLTKIAVTYAAINVVDKAMKIVGSRALSASDPMHRHFLNVRAGLYNPPMEDMVKARLAAESIEREKEESR